MADTRQVGLTGGIGSGKSTVASLFAIMNVPVYHADDRAKYLLNTDKWLKKEVQSIFGEDTYNYDHTLNRSVLANRAFNDETSIAKLNSVVHPAVKADYQSWLTTITEPYVIHEAALIFEAELDDQFNSIISVSAPDKIRWQRVQDRDGISASAVEARMKRQYSQTYKNVHSDYVIVNDEQHLLIPTVWALHQQWQSTTSMPF